MLSALRELAAITGPLPDLAGAALAGQMHGTVLLDGQARPTAPAVLWPDRRAVHTLTRWETLAEADRAALANPLAAGMTGPVLSWFAEHDPALLERSTSVVLPKDIVRHALLASPGTVVPTDRSDAAATLLWDVPADSWSAAAARAAGVPTRLLPPVAHSTDLAGHSAWLQQIFGAPAPIPVAIGAADTAAALLPLPRGAFGINLGTGCQLVAETPTAAGVLDPSTHLYADADRGWYTMAAIQNAGLALKWAAATLGLDWPTFIDLATTASPGSGGVSFLPFLAGERGRLAPAGATAGWVGATLGTTRADLARAAVEGVVCLIARAASFIDAQAGVRPVPGHRC